MSIMRREERTHDMIKVFEAFAGIGTQSMALKKLGVEFETVAISEIDKFAIKSYTAIHGETLNLGDISKLDIDDVPDHDLFIHSFPCQDISLAGKQGGLEKGSGTRSSLLWECNRVIENKKPKYLMLENVKNLVGKKFKPSFDEWLEHLESLGYTNYWQVLNAKDYGVPQNRERVFVISILGEHEPYVFPEKYELTSRLKDVLEDEVDEKYYLSEEKTEKLTLNMETSTSNVIGKLDYSNYDQTNRVYNPDKEAPALNTMGGGDRQPKIIDDQGRTKKKLKLKEYAPTLRAQSHGNEPKVVEGIPVKNATKKGYLIAHNGDGIDLAYPESETRRGRVQKERSHTITTSDNLGTVENISDKFSFVKKKSREIIAEKGTLPEYYNPYNKSEIGDTSPTITTSSNRASSSGQVMINRDFRIRKLTPKECWRLMGCSDEDFHKAEEVNSNTQLYKQAGNAIVVDVLEHLFRNLLLK